MPRVTGTSRGTGLSLRHADENNVTTNVKNAVKNVKGAPLKEKAKRGGNAVKRTAEESALSVVDANVDAKTRRRAALGEITNAKTDTAAGGFEKQSKTLKSQMKKGLSVIVNKTAAITNNANSGKASTTISLAAPTSTIIAVKGKEQTSNEENGKSKNKNTSTKRCSRVKEAAETSTSSLEEDIEMLSFENTTRSSSLPCSQEQEQLAKQLEGKTQELYGHTSDDVESSLSSSLSTQASDLDDYQSADEQANKEPEPPSSRYVPPPRSLPPSEVQDFDLENWKDPTQCSQYAQDIFQYYKNREEQFRCPDYLHSMPTGKRRGSIGKADITESMRAILVDWLVEVQESFELNHETLYTAVKLMDLYLSKVFVTKEDLQLVGATACLIACKIDERIPPNLDDFVYVCDDAYSRQEIMAKERDMIETVDYDVGYPLSYRFLRRFGRVCQVSMPTLTLARYILETSLMEYKFNVVLSESLLAAATLVLAMKVQNIDSSKWIGALHFYSGHDMPKIRPVFHALHQMMLQDLRDSTKTIRQKYSHRVFHEVALIKIPQIIQLTESE